MTECTYKKNLARIMTADRNRTNAARTSDYKESWTNFWDIARSIEPCQCDTCTSDRVIEKISGEEKDETMLEYIAKNGWRSTNQYPP